MLGFVNAFPTPEAEALAHWGGGGYGGHHGGGWGGHHGGYYG